MSEFQRFVSRGTPRVESGAFGGAGERVVNDNRKPIYLVFILDTSGSMGGVSTVISETGESVSISKIEQLNQAMKNVWACLKSFEDNNPLYRLKLQLIELNSYGQAFFPEFHPVSRGFEEIHFEAGGCTELRASLNTLKTFISPKYLCDDRPEREGRGYNKAVSVVLMSDGWPTDSNGFEQDGPAYRAVVDEFKSYLATMGYDRNVDLYSMAVGDDACEDMLRYFCDGDGDAGEHSRFYRVHEHESLASAFQYVTRATLAHHTVFPVIDTGDTDADEDGADKVLGADALTATADAEAVAEPPVTEEETKTPDADTADATRPLPYIDKKKCQGAAACIECYLVCREGAISIDEEGFLTVDTFKCNGCGRCIGACAHGAIGEMGLEDMLDGLFDDIV